MKKGWNIFSLTISGIPFPLSLTLISTFAIHFLCANGNSWFITFRLLFFLFRDSIESIIVKIKQHTANILRDYIDLSNCQVKIIIQCGIKGFILSAETLIG